VKETQKGPLMKTGEVIKDETRSKWSIFLRKGLNSWDLILWEKKST
jgi:hypothetical protein